MNNTSGSLDTNVLLRLILNDLPVQHQAVATLFEHSSAAFQVADVAIIEVAYVLTKNYGYSRSQAVEIISGLLFLPKINCNRVVFTQALRLFIKHQSWSFEDCYLATSAMLNDAEPLWTFDKKLAKQVANARLVMTR